MSQGDAKIGAISSIEVSSNMTIQPLAGETWLLKSIGYSGAVEVYITDGTNSILVASDATTGQMLGLNLLLSNSQYVIVKNVKTSAILARYDAVQWS